MRSCTALMLHLCQHKTCWIMQADLACSHDSRYLDQCCQYVVVVFSLAWTFTLLMPLLPIRFADASPQGHFDWLLSICHSLTAKCVASASTAFTALANQAAGHEGACLATAGQQDDDALRPGNHHDLLIVPYHNHGVFKQHALQSKALPSSLLINCQLHVLGCKTMKCKHIYPCMLIPGLHMFA